MNGDLQPVAGPSSPRQSERIPEEDVSAFDDLPEPMVLPVQTMLDNFETVNVLAPLVRCSKLPFRHLCSLYETHVNHTPMILAEEFSRHQVARTSDFSTSSAERGVYWMEPRHAGSSRTTVHPEDRVSKTYHTPRPHDRLPPTATGPTKQSVLVKGALVAQFASPNGPSLADAAELISPYVDGIDLNCGCPQKWAYQEGIGCALLRKPDLVRDMVRCVKDRMGWNWPVSVKIRVDPDLKLTDTLVKSAVSAGASHITIHGRTRHQASTEPVDLDAIKFAVECAKGEVPTVANGDLWDLGDAARMRETGVKGVMGARGLLANPALFAGYDKTPSHCVEQFVNISLDYGLIFPLFHRHLAYMLESRFSRAEKTWFNSLCSSAGAVDHLASRGIDFASSRGTIWDARRGRTILRV